MAWRAPKEIEEMNFETECHCFKNHSKMISTLNAAVAHLIMLLLQEANLVVMLFIKRCVGQNVIPFFKTCNLPPSGEKNKNVESTVV